MGQSETFPPSKDESGLMNDYYRDIFERYVDGESIEPRERRALVWYLTHTPNGRLSALNAVKPLRSHHLDELMK